jgi:hypothetical protein
MLQVVVIILANKKKSLVFWKLFFQKKRIYEKTNQDNFNKMATKNVIRRGHLGPRNKKKKKISTI